MLHKSPQSFVNMIREGLNVLWKLLTSLNVFECLVNEQVKNYLAKNDILSSTQSGFRQGHSTIIAMTYVLNYFISALD